MSVSGPDLKKKIEAFSLFLEKCYKISISDRQKKTNFSYILHSFPTFGAAKSTEIFHSM